jgi:hypothetical protein
MEQPGVLRDLPGAALGGVDVGIPREPFDQGMRLLAKRPTFLCRKLSLNQETSILIIEAALLLCQHLNRLSFPGILIAGAYKPAFETVY